MSDPTINIAELQSVTWHQTAFVSDEIVALRAAAPVLLEIAAAAISYRRVIEGDATFRQIDVAMAALDAALAKVRP
jgi:hypothetical protein